MYLKLRTILLVAFTLVATIPVMFLGFWVQESALEKEIAAVEEKHLIIARNLTVALDRYAQDTIAVFNLFTDMITIEGARQAVPSASHLGLSRLLGFRYFGLASDNGRLTLLLNGEGRKIDVMDPRVIEKIRAQATDRPSFTGVMPDTLGRPTIFLVQRLAPGGIAVGAISTDYMQQLQKAISFGRRGHSAIVDRFGNTIAHPSAKWQANLANIAKIEPVARMIRGESGVAKFYSPVMKGNMIAGFNTVPDTGWGVMVPQPMAELEERAGQVRIIAAVLALGGLGVAALLGWLIAGVLTRPVSAVVSAARELADGNLAVRVPPPSGATSPEFRELSDVFNRMAESIQESQKQLAAAVTRARVADRAKSEFLANTSHELRTPLNAIIGFSEAIQAKLYGPLGDSRYDEQIAHIHDSGKRLLNIVNDVLDVSRISSGNLELVQAEVDSRAVIDACVSMIGERAEAGKVDINLNLDPDTPMAWADERALKQVVLNLLSNAVKFTPPGGSVTISSSRASDESLRIQVSDTGIGIDMTELDRIFEPFGQLDGALNRSYEGLGLGLPLAKALTEGHGGKLVISSAPDEGTTVVVTFPPGRQATTAAQGLDGEHTPPSGMAAQPNRLSAHG